MTVDRSAGTGGLDEVRAHARLKATEPPPADMYRASDAVENDEWVAELEAAAETLDLDAEATATARDLFLSTVPQTDRSKRPAVAASLYAGALIVGDGRAQTAVADAVGVSRLAVQKRWKEVLAEAGFDPPDW